MQSSSGTKIYPRGQVNKVGSDCLTIPNYVDGSICNKVLLNLEFVEVIEVVIKD